MFARHLFATGDPRQLDDAVTAIRTEGRELLRAEPGYTGMAIFTDPALGKLLIGSFWETEEACRASNEALAERRAKMLDPFAATLSAEMFEVALVHQYRQPGPGATMRRMIVEFDPSETDSRMEALRALNPILDAMPGFCRASVFLDRARGRAVIGAIFADRVALEASRATAAGARERAGQQAGTPMAMRSLEEFDVALYEAPAA